MPKCNEYRAICETCKEAFLIKKRNERGELVDLESIYNIFNNENPMILKYVCKKCWEAAGGIGEGHPEILKGLKGVEALE